MMSSRGGFTLLETLVALAIVAVGLTAGIRAASVSVESAWRIRAGTYALWTAQNILAERRALDGAENSSGYDTSGEVSMGGIKLYWRETVADDGSGTLEVFDKPEGGLMLTSLRGAAQ